MRSFIVRVYRRQPGGELSGTVQAVGAAAQLIPAASFASVTEPLQQIGVPARPKPAAAAVRAKLPER